jgi:hypothetical protein
MGYQINVSYDRSYNIYIPKRNLNITEFSSFVSFHRYDILLTYICLLVLNKTIERDNTWFTCTVLFPFRPLYLAYDI